GGAPDRTDGGFPGADIEPGPGRIVRSAPGTCRPDAPEPPRCPALHHREGCRLPPSPRVTTRRRRLTTLRTGAAPRRRAAHNSNPISPETPADARARPGCRASADESDRRAGPLSALPIKQVATQPPVPARAGSRPVAGTRGRWPARCRL